MTAAALDRSDSRPPPALAAPAPAHSAPARHGNTPRFGALYVPGPPAAPTVRQRIIAHRAGYLVGCGDLAPLNPYPATDRRNADWLAGYAMGQSERGMQTEVTR